MVEATWDQSQVQIAWAMSAALENVPRGDSDFAEVTSFEGAVRAWLELDAEHQRHARLTSERPIQLEGVATTILTGEAIGKLAKFLPTAAPSER